MNANAEWLEADGLGGYASGTIGGLRTRRYHALLAAALAPPAGRHVLVNGFDAFVESDAGRVALSSQKYAPDVVAPDGATRIASFASEPWPTWTFRFEDGTELVHELFMPRGTPAAVLSWRVTKRAKGAKRLALIVRPFLSGRDHHALHRENGALRFDSDDAADARGDARLSWRPYESLPAIASLANGAWRQEPHWYRGFLYDEERARGFDATEDLASPGELTFDLSKGAKSEAFWIVGAGADLLDAKGSVEALAKKLRAAESRRRAAFATPLQRAADAFLVKRGDGSTIVAGYPWFADWGRDTFLALRGLCLATGRIAEARDVLLEWAGVLSEGLLPNRFPDQGEAPEYNAVDATLWFVVAVEELLAAAGRGRGGAVSKGDEKRLLAAVRAILDALVVGTRFRIKMDEDGLLAAGEPGQQLTWMDARADGREVTPRIGKPVEIQALWFNALSFAAARLADGRRFKALATRARNAFLDRFWNESAGALFDVVDANHEKGATDGSFRPNQLLAIGGLRRALLAGPRAKQVVDAVEQKLVTPLGLRTLAPDDPRYCARYEGGPSQRDAAYHQGTVWPWLIGPFVDAWIKVNGDGASTRKQAHDRFVRPLLDAMSDRGVAHLCELTDAEPPQGWKGCPFQAWSLGELLRVAPDATLARTRAKARAAKG